MWTFIPNLAKPDIYFSGRKQPVQVLAAGVTQPRLKRPGRAKTGNGEPEEQNRFRSSEDKQQEVNNHNQFQHWNDDTRGGSGCTAA